MSCVTRKLTRSHVSVW